MWNLLNLSWGLLLYSGTIASALTTTHSCVTTKKVAGLNKPMQYNYLGSSDLLVSRVTLGTMTFGNQNTMQEGVAQMNRAFDHYGINAIDTAEMYPVPPVPETKFRTDECVRQFLQTRDRKDVILMTKIAGTSSRIDWLRDDFAGSKLAKLTKEQIAYSIDASLKRLDVAYIDLIQLHWPDRYVGDMFGGVDYLKSKETTDVDVSFEEQLAALNDAVKAGKVRYVGLSNESAFGVMSFVNLAERFPELYCKVVSIQNSYSLLVRKNFESGLSEVCSPRNCNVGLLAYSPLAGGMLSGKYNKKKDGDGEDLSNCRLMKFPGFMDRYRQSQPEAAVDAYASIAKKYDLSPTQLALAWCFHNENVASSIIGATTFAQLEENLKSFDLELSEECLNEITEVYKQYVDPTKAYKVVKKQ